MQYFLCQKIRFWHNWNTYNGQITMHKSQCRRSGIECNLLCSLFTPSSLNTFITLMNRAYQCTIVATFRLSSSFFGILAHFRTSTDKPLRILKPTSRKELQIGESKFKHVAGRGEYSTKKPSLSLSKENDRKPGKEGRHEDYRSLVYSIA